MFNGLTICIECPPSPGPASRAEIRQQARELHVRDQRVGHGFDDLPVGTGEPAVALEAHQRAQLVDHAAHLAAHVLAVSLGELVEPRDQRRQHAQPFERRIPEHEIQELAPGFDASVLALVADALGVEQRFVELQQRVPQLVVVGGICLGHGVPVYRNRPSWGQIPGFPPRPYSPSGSTSSGPSGMSFTESSRMSCERASGCLLWIRKTRIALRAPAHYNAIIDCTEAATMPSITIRNLDEQTKERLRVRAARRKRSMEDEARNILRAAVLEGEAPSHNLAEAIRRRFEPLGGVKLPLPRREPVREPPKPGR